MIGAARKREKGGKRGGAGARSVPDGVRRRGKKGGREAGEGGAGESKKTTEPYLKKLTKKDVFFIFFSK